MHPDHRTCKLPGDTFIYDPGMTFRRGDWKNSPVFHIIGYYDDHEGGPAYWVEESGQPVAAAPVTRGRIMSQNIVEEHAVRVDVLVLPDTASLAL